MGFFDSFRKTPEKTPEKTLEKPTIKSEFKFSTNWLRRKNLTTLKDTLSAKNDPINILELGTFEGRSAFYMLDNFCSHKDSTITTIDFTVRDNLEYNLSLLVNIIPPSPVVICLFG